MADDALDVFKGKDIPLDDTDLHEDISDALDRLMTPRQRKKFAYRQWLLEQRVDEVAKHEGPGPHPGTGTEQEVHAGGMASGVRGLTREQRMEIGILPELQRGEDFQGSLLNAVKTLRSRLLRRTELLGPDEGVEELYAIGPKGEEKLRKIGTADSVNFTIADGIKVYDSYIVHTHPAYRPNERISMQSPLSDGDMLSALILGARGVMAVSPDGLFSMRVHLPADAEERREEIAEYMTDRIEKDLYPKLLKEDNSYRNDVTNQHYFDAVDDIQRDVMEKFKGDVTFNRVHRGQQTPSRALPARP